MMNVLGLSLLVTSLAAAGVFSPSAEKQPAAGSTIVKEGHRVVVVEYDEDGHHNTKISISPPPPSEQHSGGVLNTAKEKIKEAASVLPNMGQGISSSSQYDSQQQHAVDPAAILHAPKELICDAYGKCKHKIASAMGKAQQVIDLERDSVAAKRDAVRQEAQYVKETGQTLAEHIGRNVSDAKDAVKKRIAAAYLGGLDSLMGVADLIGFATAYGMCVWVTFISSYVLARAMPRQQFAVVQSKIYPVYFRAMAYSIGMAFLGHVLAHRNRLFSARPEMLQAWNLAASLLTVFLNSLYLEPRATKLMFERMKLEKEEGRGREDMTAERSRTTTEEQQQKQQSADPKESTTTAGTTNAAAAAAASPTRVAEQDAVRARIIKLNEKLKKFNSYSSHLNILNLMSLTWHLVYLAQRVHRVC